MPPTPVRWTRLEPTARTQALDGGLRAEVHDPLWMLARQWQFGEFLGDDVGSPVRVSMRMDSTPLTRYLPGDLPANWFPIPGGPAPVPPSVVGQRLDRAMPLEAIIERETVRESTASRPRLATEAGLHFQRLLAANRLSQYRDAILAQFRLAPLASSPSLDLETQRFVSVVSNRVIDGDLLARVLKAIRAGASAVSALPGPARTAAQWWQSWRPTLPAADTTSLDACVSAFVNWFDAVFLEPDPAQGASTWQPQRFEYAAAVAAPSRDGEVVLTLSGYAQGHLDWHSFDALAGGSLGSVRGDLLPDEQQREAITRTVIPTPVHFPGMPASRYWEFEDARVDFGSIAAGAQQLAHLLLVEFALIGGDDWFIIPVDAPVGTLCRTRWVVVTDTFGERTLIPSARAVDQLGGQTQLPWDMFRVSLDPRRVPGGQRTAPDALLLPATLGVSLDGPPLEEVTLLRDELANMAWAVEQRVENGVGQPLDRAAQWHQADHAEAPTPVDGAAFSYRLATTVPDYWLPLVAVRSDPSQSATRLQRGGTPQGRMLTADGQAGTGVLQVFTEEVPREGARLRRAFQYARWIDGRTFLWSARQKDAGRGEASSGLRFDVLETPPPRKDRE
jgi:hypothetical protein